MGLRQARVRMDDGQYVALTVWRKSLLFNCNGFTVIDSKGNLVYRVDNYTKNDREELVLMDSAGKPLHTMRRKRLSLLDNWLVFDGEVSNRSLYPKFPICSVRKHTSLRQGKNKASVHMSCNESTYVVEGTYRNRSCQVVDASRKVVMEIRKKEATIGGVSFGADVFRLIVRPGFDAGFAMAMVVLLDQMFG